MGGKPHETEQQKRAEGLVRAVISWSVCARRGFSCWRHALASEKRALDSPELAPLSRS